MHRRTRCALAQQAPPASTGIGAYCKGGGYTPCSPSTDDQSCFNDHVVRMCDATPVAGTTQTVWAGQDCRTVDPSYICGTGPNGVMGCIAP